MCHNFVHFYIFFSCCQIPSVGGCSNLILVAHKSMLNSTIRSVPIYRILPCKRQTPMTKAWEQTQTFDQKKKKHVKKEKTIAPMPAKIKWTPVRWIKENEGKSILKRKRKNVRKKRRNSKFSYKFYLWFFASHTVKVRRRRRPVECASWPNQTERQRHTYDG